MITKTDELVWTMYQRERRKWERLTIRVLGFIVYRRWVARSNEFVKG